MAINLLPIELAPKGSAVKIAVYLRTFVTILVSAFVLMALLFSALFVINLFQLQSLSNNAKILNDKITALESTEQKFFLVKDRLHFSGEVLRTASAQEQMQQMSKILAFFPSDISLVQAEASKSKFGIAIKTTNSTSLVNFMSGVMATPGFTKINLVSFAFTPTTGYNVGLEFSK